MNQYLYETLDIVTTTPSYLFVQMSEQCIIDNSSSTPILKALKEDFLDVTEAFTADRPVRHEFTNTTADFFSAFNEHFDDGGENGKGWPNSAITLVKDGKSFGVAVSAFVGSYVDPSDTYYGYELKQYPDQAAFTSVEDLLDGADSVTFDHCSIFIDSWWRSVAHSVIPAVAGAGAAVGCAGAVTAATDGAAAVLAPVAGAACNAAVKQVVSNLMNN